MSSITIPITEENLGRLAQRASRLGLELEELARAGMEEWLRQSDPEFQQGLDYVLRKNAELYRRLA